MIKSGDIVEYMMQRYDFNNLPYTEKSYGCVTNVNSSGIVTFKNISCEYSGKLFAGILESRRPHDVRKLTDEEAMLFLLESL
jgi:hypothetical protein